nr:glycoprotein N [Macronycteris gammaherpesvirus 1]
MQSQSFLFNSALVLLLNIGFAICANEADNNTSNFYSYSCNADTYELQLTSFSTVWTLLDVLVVSLACAIYLMYLCFNKFVNTMALA